jgi:nitrogen regulatory protein P-II 1
LAVQKIKVLLKYNPYNNVLELPKVKKIEAIIREEKFEAVKKALEENGFLGMTVSEVQGRGQQKGIKLQWRAGEYTIDLLTKLKIEVIVTDKDALKVVDIIRVSARSGDIGDGIIFVQPVEELIRIRTGETGEGILTKNRDNQAD